MIDFEICDLFLFVSQFIYFKLVALKLSPLLFRTWKKSLAALSLIVR